MVRCHVKKNDEVVVISGADKGKRGRVIAVQPKRGRVIVEGVRVVTKNIRKGRSQSMPQGGQMKREASIHISNVMRADLYDARVARRRGGAAAATPQA
jgi:large subunit ribosomal protein L24